MFNSTARRILVLIVVSLGAATQAQTPATLSVASWKGGGSELAAFPELIAKFERENPSIKVQLQYAPHDDLIASLNTKFQAGEAPDVIMVDGSSMRNFAQAGVLADLSQQAWLGKVNPDVLKLSRVNGKQFVFPMELSGIGMFVNTDLLKKAGVIGVPVTMVDFKRACSALKKAGVTPLLLPSKGGWTAAKVMQILGTDEALRADRQFVTKINTGEATFSGTPAFKKALAALDELADAGCYDPKLNAGIDPWSTGLDQFQTGQVAFLPQGSWNIQTFSKNKDLRYVFAPLPALSGSKGTGSNYLGTSWAVNASAKNAAAAQKWLTFWTRDENLQRFLIADGANSTLINGTSGLPNLARPFLASIKAGGVHIDPEGFWKTSVTNAFQESISGFLQNTKQDPTALLARWDTANQQK